MASILETFSPSEHIAIRTAKHGSVVSFTPQGIYTFKNGLEFTRHEGSDPGVYHRAGTLALINPGCEFITLSALEKRALSDIPCDTDFLNLTVRVIGAKAVLPTQDIDRLLSDHSPIGSIGYVDAVPPVQLMNHMLEHPRSSVWASEHIWAEHLHRAGYRGMVGVDTRYFVRGGERIGHYAIPTYHDTQKLLAQSSPRENPQR